MRRSQPRIAFFGHFDGSNFGNESTLWATLEGLRSMVPEACFNCICTGPANTSAAYNISAVASRDYVVRPWTTQGPLTKWMRRLLVGTPSEIYRWLHGFKTLWHTDALVIPGTGLLTDAYTLLNWGPYDMFRWSVTAKLCGCKLMFVSVGAGPIYSRTGRFFVKTALSLADFRSYRDVSTQQYLKSIGFPADHDPVYPDLAFSLSAPVIPDGANTGAQRTVVGIGLMEYAGRYSVERPTSAIPSAYMDALVEFVKWLLAHEYDVRLLIGDLVDRPVTQEFRSLLERTGVYDEESNYRRAGRIGRGPVGATCSD